MLPRHILTTLLDTLWAALWAFVYRKFFWDFVSGTIRNPGGVQYVGVYPWQMAIAAY